MSTIMGFSIREISGEDIHLFRELLSMFGEVFEEMDTYTSAQPAEAYLKNLLASEQVIALAAVQYDQVVGGLVAYELKKFERERSEIYIYDLAVAADHRRRGIATALIECVKGIASRRGAYVIFVQADPGDAAAIALYAKLGKREEVLHFDMPVE